MFLFIFFDDPSFENYDWTVEPAESIRSLMVQRAHQLRDTYSYLKFWFSGGADSTTALNIFLDESIYIDEIVVYKFAPNGADKNLGDYEIDNYVLPYLHKIHQSIPNTKINIITYDKVYFDTYLGEKWVHTKNNLSIRHFHTPKIKGKNFCNIVCDGEPMIDTKDGKWHAELWDTDNYGEFTSYRNIELFYTTPDFPQLHVKQCHLMKKILEPNHTKRPKYPVYKELMRTRVRDTPIAPEPYWFKKSDTSSNMIGYSLGPKDKAMLKDMTSFQRDMVRYQMNLSVDGKKLYRLQHGFKAHTFFLGD